MTHGLRQHSAPTVLGSLTHSQSDTLELSHRAHSHCSTNRSALLPIAPAVTLDPFVPKTIRAWLVV